MYKRSGGWGTGTDLYSPPSRHPPLHLKEGVADRSLHLGRLLPFGTLEVEVSTTRHDCPRDRSVVPWVVGLPETLIVPIRWMSRSGRGKGGRPNVPGVSVVDGVHRQTRFVIFSQVSDIVSPSIKFGYVIRRDDLSFFSF